MSHKDDIENSAFDSWNDVFSLRDGWDGKGSYAPFPDTIKTYQRIRDQIPFEHPYMWVESNGVMAVETDQPTDDGKWPDGYATFYVGTSSCNGYVTLPDGTTHYYNFSVEDFPVEQFKADMAKITYKER